MIIDNSVVLTSNVPAPPSHQLKNSGPMFRKAIERVRRYAEDRSEQESHRVSSAYRSPIQERIDKYKEEAKKRNQREEARHVEITVSSAGCKQCESGGTQCGHCSQSDTDEGDLICFQCQSERKICPGCEASTSRSLVRQATTDSEETPDESVSANERLETIAEAKGDTTSDTSEDNRTKLNGTPRTKYFNYMIVLFV